MTQGYDPVVTLTKTLNALRLDISELKVQQLSKEDMRAFIAALQDAGKNGVPLLGGPV